MPTPPPPPPNGTHDGAALVGTLFVQRHGARVGVSGGRFAVSVDGCEVLRPPRHEVRRLVLLGDIQVTAAALRLASELAAPITWITLGGRVAGQYQPLLHLGASDAHRALAARGFQWECHADPQSPLAHRFARRFLQGKIDNTRALMLRAAQRASTPPCEARDLERAAAILTAQHASLGPGRSLDELRGHEGTAARAFFRYLPFLLAPSVRADFPFRRRTRRPPRCPLNALLSFLYALLAAECASALHGAGLEVQLGFLHGARNGRPALALDLMEELRPAVADRFALALINRRQITPAHFERRPEEPAGGEEQEDDGDRDDEFRAGDRDDGPPTFLNEEGRRAVLRLWRQRLADTVSHPAARHAVPWRLVPHLQAARLAEALVRQEADHYEPFRSSR